MSSISLSIYYADYNITLPRTQNNQPQQQYNRSVRSHDGSFEPRAPILVLLPQLPYYSNETGQTERKMAGGSVWAEEEKGGIVLDSILWPDMWIGVTIGLERG